MEQLPVFVYGTLRPGSWNHDRWLVPWLARPCRRASLRGFELHHHDGLPYLVPGGDDVVAGDVADLDPERYDEAMAKLDELEGIDLGHLVRAEAELAGGERAWVYLAGPLVADALGPSTRVGHGDWLAVS